MCDTDGPSNAYWVMHKDQEATIHKLKADNAKLRSTLTVIKANSINPSRTMTRLGLIEVTDANHKIAEQALKEET